MVSGERTHKLITVSTWPASYSLTAIPVLAVLVTFFSGLTWLVSCLSCGVCAVSRSGILEAIDAPHSTPSWVCCYSACVRSFVCAYVMLPCWCWCCRWHVIHAPSTSSGVLVQGWWSVVYTLYFMLYCASDTALLSHVVSWLHRTRVRYILRPARSLCSHLLRLMSAAGLTDWQDIVEVSQAWRGKVERANRTNLLPCHLWVMTTCFVAFCVLFLEPYDNMPLNLLRDYFSLRHVTSEHFDVPSAMIRQMHQCNRHHVSPLIRSSQLDQLSLATHLALCAGGTSNTRKCWAFDSNCLMVSWERSKWNIWMTGCCNLSFRYLQRYVLVLNNVM